MLRSRWGGRRREYFKNISGERYYCQNKSHGDQPCTPRSRTAAEVRTAGPRGHVDAARGRPRRVDATGRRRQPRGRPDRPAPRRRRGAARPGGALQTRRCRGDRHQAGGRARADTRGHAGADARRARAHLAGRLDDDLRVRAQPARCAGRRQHRSRGSAGDAVHPRDPEIGPSDQGRRAAAAADHRPAVDTAAPGRQACRRTARGRNSLPGRRGIMVEPSRSASCR